MKLSDFKDEKAVEVVANLLSPITKIVKSDQFRLLTVRNRMELAQLILRADADAARELLAILSDASIAEYVCTGETVMQDILAAVSDDAFASLFILPRQKAKDKSSASVSANVNAET